MLTEKQFLIERATMVKGLKDLSKQLSSLTSALNEDMTYQEYVELFQILQRYHTTLRVLM